MKILTLWQPYASLIALGLKQYETRSWGTTYRGPLVIHAAKRPFVNADGSKTICQSSWQAWLKASSLVEAERWADIPLATELPLGAVVAITHLEDCRRTEAIQPTPLESAVGDWADGRFVLRLTDLQPLPTPIPWAGQQGLRDAPAEIQDKIRAVLRDGQ